MQISGFPIVIPQTQRGDITERIQKDAPRDSARNDAERDAPSLEELNAIDEVALQQRVDAQERIQRINDNRQQSAEQFPLSTQRALEAFNSNSPTPEQQLGIELVGVDTFA